MSTQEGLMDEVQTFEGVVSQLTAYNTLGTIGSVGLGVALVLGLLVLFLGLNAMANRITHRH